MIISICAYLQTYSGKLDISVKNVYHSIIETNTTQHNKGGISMNQALQEWNDQLAALADYPESSLRDGKTALVIVDMVNGFLTEDLIGSADG